MYKYLSTLYKEPINKGNVSNESCGTRNKEKDCRLSGAKEWVGFIVCRCKASVPCLVIRSTYILFQGGAISPCHATCSVRTYSVHT